MRHDINDVNRPEYNRNPPNNGPACYTMGSRACATVRFWHAKTLDQIVDVNVCGVTVNDANNIGSWDASLMVSRWKTNWQTSQASGCIALEPINNSIETHEYDTQWYYWCPEGLFAWIPTTVVQDSELFVVYDGPKCDSQHYTKSNIREAIDKALGESTEPNIASEANDNVASALYSGCICNQEFQVNFDAAMGRYPANPPKGMCCCRAEGLNCVLQVLGIGPYSHVWVNERAEPGSSAKIPAICGTCSTVYRCYWAGFWSHWEGAVRSGVAGTTCYAPADLSGGFDEGTYSQFQAKLSSDYGFFWVKSPYAALTDKCPHNLPPPSP